MSNPFFDHPILNLPYAAPARHWELDLQGQPTQKIVEARRRASFVTLIPKPKKHKKKAGQDEMVFQEGAGLSTKEQQYDPTSIINEVRQSVETWRALPNPAQWQVTPETARLLQHWRHHQYGGVRPFFCQIEAVETAIWLTEVAPHARGGKRVLDLLAAANHVIHLTRWWNPAVEDQCTDLTYRIGQTKSVHVHLPMALLPGREEAGFDRRLHALLLRKRELSRDLLMPYGASQADAEQLYRETVESNPVQHRPVATITNFRGQPTIKWNVMLMSSGQVE